MKLLVPKNLDVSVVPSGFLRYTVQKLLPPVNETLLIFKFTRWLTVPLKVSWPFCPATVVVTVTAEPLAVIEPVVSAGTS